METHSKGDSTSIADRYEALEPRCENEFTTAYRARGAHGDSVIVQVPVQRLLEHGSFAYQLERVSLEIARVKHPHIVRVLDAGRADSVPFVVCADVGDDTLARRLETDRGGQTPTEAYAWLIDVAEALDFIHAKKVVHGQVRPEHVFFEQGDHVRVSDYAIAAAIGALDVSSQRALRPEREGFTAPEVVGGEPPMPSSDQWSLAATAYLALTGEPVVADRNAMQAILRTRLSEEATEDMMRALSPAPAARFPSCYEFARAFGLERKRTREERPSADEAHAPPPPTPALESPVEVGAGRWWRVHLGLRDQHARAARDGGFIAAGWEELGSLADVGAEPDAATLHRVVEHFERTYGVSGLQARHGAGQVLRFLSGLEPGSLVVVPNPDEAQVHIGRVDGAATWVPAPADGCRLPRRRPVTWIRDVPIDALPVALREAIGGTAPIVDLDRHRRLLRALVRPEAGARPDADREAGLLDRIVDAVDAKSTTGFRAFVSALFTALGFDAELLPGATEEVWEAAGTLTGSGLADTPLRIWVHHSRQDLDVPVVWEARGTLAADEHGAILTLGAFSQRARQEACAEGKKCIRLVDGRALASLVLAHWQELPEALRSGLGIRRVEHATIEVRFEPE